MTDNLCQAGRQICLWGTGRAVYLWYTGLPVWGLQEGQSVCSVYDCLSGGYSKGRLSVVYRALSVGDYRKGSLFVVYMTLSIWELQEGQSVCGVQDCLSGVTERAAWLFQCEQHCCVWHLSLRLLFCRSCVTLALSPPEAVCVC